MTDKVHDLDGIQSALNVSQRWMEGITFIAEDGIERHHLTALKFHIQKAIITAENLMRYYKGRGTELPPTPHPAGQTASINTTTILKEITP